MKIVYITISILYLGCTARVDWDNNGKPVYTYTYEHPHDGNLTKAEIQKKPGATSSDGNGMYRIKPQEEINGQPIQTHVQGDRNKKNN